MLVAEFHVSRQREEPEGQEKYRDPPLEALQYYAGSIGILAFEPAPFDCQSVKADAPMQLHVEQKDQIKRPPIAAPHAVRRFVWADVTWMNEHLVQMNGGEKEKRESRHRLDPPERCVFMPQQFSVAAEFSVLVIVGGKLAHCEEAVEHEHKCDESDDRADQAGVALAEKHLPFEHPGDPIHSIVADQNRRDESHVSPHEETEKQSARALRKIQPRGPVTFSRSLIQSDTGNDIELGLVIHWQCSYPCTGKLARVDLEPLLEVFTYQMSSDNLIIGLLDFGPIGVRADLRRWRCSFFRAGFLC